MIQLLRSTKADFRTHCMFITAKQMAALWLLAVIAVFCWAATASYATPFIALGDDALSGLEGDVSMPDGQPAIGASVYLLKSTGGSIVLPTSPIATKTDDAGRFQLKDLEPGTYRIWAETAKWTSLEEKFRGMKIELPLGPDASPRVQLRLHEGCKYEVRVIDAETSKPIEKANVSFAWRDIARNYTTNSDGEVTIVGLGMDEWHFVVRAPDHAVQFRKTPKQPLGSTTKLAFELEPGATLIGTVRDEQGNAVVGAKVSASITRGNAPALDSTVTDANGNYQIASLPISTSLDLDIRADGFLTFNQVFVIAIDQREMRVDGVISRRPYGGDCIINVVDENGQPIVAADVRNLGNSSADFVQSKTDALGNARLTDLRTGYSGCKATVRAPGYIAQMVDLETGTMDEPGRVTVVMVEGASISGRLLKPNGEPAAKVWVFYNRGEQGPFELGGRVDTDQEGRFQIDGLPDPCTFTIYTPAPYAPIRDRVLPVGTDEEIELTMEEEAVLRVRAVDAESGHPIREFNVQITFSSVRRPNDPVVSYPSTLNNPGTEVLGDQKEFRLGQLPLGAAFQVTVSAKGYSKSLLERVEAVHEADSSLVDVELEREDESMLRTVSGVIRDSQGMAVSGALLQLLVGQGVRKLHPWQMIEESNQLESDPSCLQLLKTTSKRDGSFRFDRVKTGDWMELIHTGGHVANGRQFIEEPEDKEELHHVEIEAERGGKLTITIDDNVYPQAKSIVIYSNNSQTAYGYSTFPLSNGTKETIVENLHSGVYTLCLNSAPIELGNGSYQTVTLKTMQVVVEELSDEAIVFE